MCTCNEQINVYADLGSYVHGYTDILCPNTQILFHERTYANNYEITHDSQRLLQEYCLNTVRQK